MTDQLERDCLAAQKKGKKSTSKKNPEMFVRTTHESSSASEEKEDKVFDGGFHARSPGGTGEEGIRWGGGGGGPGFRMGSLI